MEPDDIKNSLVPWKDPASAHDNKDDFHQSKLHSEGEFTYNIADKGDRHLIYHGKSWLNVIPDSYGNVHLFDPDVLQGKVQPGEPQVINLDENMRQYGLTPYTGEIMAQIIQNKEPIYYPVVSNDKCDATANQSQVV